MRWLRDVPLGSVVILAAALAGAALAPWLAPLDPDQVDLLHRFTPPFWLEGGSAEHVLGSDDLGRDILSRLLWGGRVSMLVAVVCVASDAVVGTLVGMLAVILAAGWIRC
jgi:peptide/nickel transport system permease protein